MRHVRVSRFWCGGGCTQLPSVVVCAMVTAMSWCRRFNGSSLFCNLVTAPASVVFVCPGPSLLHLLVWLVCACVCVRVFPSHRTSLLTRPSSLHCQRWSGVVASARRPPSGSCIQLFSVRQVAHWENRYSLLYGGCALARNLGACGRCRFGTVYCAFPALLSRML